MSHTFPKIYLFLKTKIRQVLSSQIFQRQTRVWISAFQVKVKHQQSHAEVSLSAGRKILGLTASTQFSKSCLYFCHHFTPFQGSGTQDNPPLKFKTSKLRWTIVGLGLGFITNSIINHLFPALGVTAEPNGTFSITASYNIHIFLLFLTGLKV